jgi:hypothetical protein
LLGRELLSTSRRRYGLLALSLACLLGVVSLLALRCLGPMGL